MKRVIRFLRDQKGASAAEYVLLVAAVAVLLMVGVVAWYSALTSIFQSVAGVIGNPGVGT